MSLVFDRSLGRPRNAVVLPPGWYCTFSAAPATVSELPDGSIRLDYWNDRPEPVDVLLKAKRRATPRRRLNDLSCFGREQRSRTPVPLENIGREWRHLILRRPQ